MTSVQECAQPTRVLLISGFLGAGKTTLLKHILSWQTNLTDTVVLVNEFGEVGIDGLLLEDAGSRVVELASGCICCTLQGDLRQSLTTILQEYRPRTLLIEASGVADPTTIVSVLTSPPFASDVHLEKMVTVLDADYWEARENFGLLFYHQLHTANLILLNKADLAVPDDIPRYLDEMHAEIPNCQVIPTIQCNIDASVLWSPTNDHDNRIFERSNTIQTSATSFITFSFHTKKQIYRLCFDKFIQKLPPELFRLKGTVCFESQTLLLNYVGGKAEWMSWGEASETRLVFIGWHIDPDVILNGLKMCVKG